jgi:sec-independent protein translocase protein TatA
MRLGMGEILIVLVVVLLIFGPTKLPQLGDALGRGIRSFKRATSGEDEPREPAKLTAGAQAVEEPQPLRGGAGRV